MEEIKTDSVCSNLIAEFERYTYGNDKRFMNQHYEDLSRTYRGVGAILFVFGGVTNNILFVGMAYIAITLAWHLRNPGLNGT